MPVAFIKPRLDSLHLGSLLPLASRYRAISNLVKTKGQRVAGSPRALELRALASVARTGQDPSAELKLSRFPPLQRRGYVVPCLQDRSAELPGVLCRLSGPSGRVGAQGERGVSDQADAPERHARHLDVEHRLNEWLSGLEQHLGNRRWQRGRSSVVQLIDVTLLYVPRAQGHLVHHATSLNHEVN